MNTKWLIWANFSFSTQRKTSSRRKRKKKLHTIGVMLSELPFKLWWIYFLGYLFHVINSGPLSFSFMENVFILPIHATNFPLTKNSFHLWYQLWWSIELILIKKIVAIITYDESKNNNMCPLRPNHPWTKVNCIGQQAAHLLRIKNQILGSYSSVRV